MAEAALTTGVVDDASVEKLRIEFAGEILRSGDAGFDDARVVYNGMFADRKPAVILQCTTTEDVVSAVNFSREAGLIVAVKGGGHSIAGFSAVDGGILIDLSPMNKIDVDAGSKVVEAQPGVKWAEFDAATQEHGLATPGGFISTTGIAGLTLNGGLGFLSRKFGLSCDNLIGAELVTAGGEVIQADESENTDLLWGLRGGGGNFGIVTEFTFQLHPVTDIYLSISMYPPDKGADLLRVYRDAAPSQPEEMMSALLFFEVLPNPMFPEELHNKKVWALMGGYLGPESEAEPHLKFLTDVPDHLVHFGVAMPYVMAQQMQDESTPNGNQNYWKSGFLNELTDEVIEKIARVAPTAPSPHCQVSVIGLGGAIARVGEDDTAYSSRNAAYDLSIDNVWEDPAENEKQIKWSRDFFDAIKPNLKGVYLNFIGDEGDERVRESYGAKYSKLADLKRKFDPTNLFRLNQNIKPE